MSSTIVNIGQNWASGGSVPMSASSITVTATNRLAVVVISQSGTRPTLSDGAIGNTYVTDQSHATYGGMYVYTWYVDSANAGATVVQASAALGIMVFEVSGSGSYLGSIIGTYTGVGGTQTDLITSGNLSFTGAGLSIGIGADTNQVNTGSQSSTSPQLGTGYTETSPVCGWGINGATYSGRSEYEAVASSGNVAATFTPGASYRYDGYYVVQFGFIDSGGTGQAIAWVHA